MPSRITPLISIGDIFDGQKVDPLVYGAVLNVSGTQMPERAGIVYCQRFFDDGDPIPPWDIEACFTFLAAQQGQPSEGPWCTV